MRLTFLGTSHGVPEPNRKCSCTLLETGGRYYFIDMGATVVEDLVTRGISLNDVGGVFITHMHGDHTNGLPAFCDMLSWVRSWRDADPVFCLPDLAAQDALRAWVALNGVRMKALRFVQAGDGPCFDDGNLRVTAIPTQHCPGSHAYLAEAEGKAVLFTGDLRRPDIDFPAAAGQREIALAVCECAHFPADRYEMPLRVSRVRRVCFNHYTRGNYAGLLALADTLPEIPMRIVSDGAEIVL